MHAVNPGLQGQSKQAHPFADHIRYLQRDNTSKWLIM